MTERFNMLPDNDLLELQPALATRIELVAAALRPDQFQSLVTPLMRQVLERGFAAAGAHEGTVWLLESRGEGLVPAYNTGPQAMKVVGQFTQPLKTGLISMVLATEQPFLENEVWKSTRQSKVLDSLLGVKTCAMIAVPFYFLGACRGVVSCVQLQRPGAPEPPPPGFGPEHLQQVEFATALLSQLMELRLLEQAIGWRGK